MVQCIAMVLSVAVLCSVALLCQASPVDWWKSEFAREEEKEILEDVAARIISELESAMMIQQNGGKTCLESNKTRQIFYDSANADLHQNSTDFSVTVTCNSGYSLFLTPNGRAPSRTAQQDYLRAANEVNSLKYDCNYTDSIKNQGYPKCFRLCPEINPIAYGDVTYDFRYHLAGDEATYSCKNDSFRLINGSTWTCSVNSTSAIWTSIEPTVPKCIPLCPELPDIANGAVSYSSREPGATASYSCNNQGDEFTLNGTTTRICTQVSKNKAGWSGEEPKCVQLCPIPRLPTGEGYAKGGVKYGDRKPGDVANYTCERYAELVGPETRTCLENGTWSGSDPFCRFLCPLVNPIIPNGDVDADKSPIPGPGGGFPVDTVVTYTCDNGYLLRGEDTRMCLRSGEWDHPEPSCEPLIICPSDSLPITNGEFSPSSGLIRGPGGRQGYGVGTMVNYRCVSDHFKLRGESNIICLESGEWSHPPPRCAELSPPVIICSPDSLPITNGEFSPSRGLIKGTRGRLGYGVGTVVNYRCTLDRFELRGESSIICLESREWSPPPPRCVAVRCPKLRLSGNPRSVDKTRQQILRDRPRDYQRLLIETFFKKNIKGNLVPYDEGSTAKLTCIHIDHNGWTLMPNSPSVQTCVRNSTNGDLYWTKPGICVYRYSITRPALTGGTG